jgi:hypothetical protein
VVKISTNALKSSERHNRNSGVSKYTLDGISL